MDPKELLKQSVVQMLSDSYEERFLAEYLQVTARIMLLKRMLSDWEVGTLDFKPICPRSFYEDQLTIMEDYAIVLKERADLESIDLPDIDV